MGYGMSPKFEKGQKVVFRVNGITKTGLVETIDTFFGHADVQYDIYVKKEPCLYKHVPESDVLGAVNRGVKVDKTPRPFVSKLFGKYEIVYRPLRVDNGKEIVEVYVESPLDDMKGVWIELISGTIIKNSGYDAAELNEILGILNDFRDLIYTDARDTAKGVYIPRRKRWNIALKGRKIRGSSVKKEDLLVFNSCMDIVKTKISESTEISDIERYYNQAYGMIMLASELKILRGTQAPEEVEKLQNLYYETIEK